MSTLGDKARLAVLWNAGFRFFQEFVQFGLTVVLARLLTPADYGQYGLIMGIIGFLSIFSFQSFVAHTLQVRSDHQVNYHQHFTAGAFIQLGMFLITNLVGLILRKLPPYAEIAPMVHVMSAVYILALPSTLRTKMLERELNWQRLRTLTGVAVVASAALAVVMAGAGAGVYALLLPGWSKHLVLAYDLFICQRWLPRWSLKLHTFAPAFFFGLTRIMSGLVLRGRQLAESGFFVPTVGFANYGLYGRAVGLSQISCYTFSSLLLQSIYPVLTKLEPRSESSVRTGNLVMQTVTWIAVPTAVLLAILASPIVRLVYGSQWLAAIPLVPWAMLAGATGAVTHAAYMLLLSNQKQKLCLVADLWVLTGTFISLVWALPVDITLYLLGISATQLASIAFILVCLARVEAIHVRTTLRSLAQCLLASGIALGTCEGFRYWWGLDAQNLWLAVIYGALFGITYILTLRYLFPTSLRQLVQYFPARHYVSRLLLL